MRILNAYDLTGSYRDAGELAGCSHHTVKHYVDRRAAGGELGQAAQRPMLIDEYLPKVEEWVERSKGKVRADVAHDQDSCTTPTSARPAVTPCVCQRRVKIDPLSTVES